MVKFGRHLEYYAAAQQQVAQATAAKSAVVAHQDSFSLTSDAPNEQGCVALEQHDVLYVVPYNEIKVQYIPPYLSGDQEEEKKTDDAGHDAYGDVDETSTHKPASTHDDDDEGGSSATPRTEEVSATPKAKTKGKHRNKPPPSPLSPDDTFFIMQRFKTQWRQCLASASRDFERSTKAFWTGVFEALEGAAADNIEAGQNGEGSTNANQSYLIDPDDIRGALPDTALRLYLNHVAAFSSPHDVHGHLSVQSLYTQLKNIHSTALINSEALRKLVKKFDKEMHKLGVGRANGGIDGNGNVRLSPKLLPEVYSANFNVGLPTVEAGLALVRSHLGLDDEEYDEDDDDEHLSEVHAARIRFMSMDGGDRGGLAGMIGGGPVEDDADDGGPAEDVAGFFGLTLKRRDSDAILVEKRKSELRWLRKLVASVKEADAQARADGDGFTIDMISCLVGHRGFHSIKDKSDKRPLENSLMAYEAAWTNGIHLCECDIALTSDDRLILAHDENFVRLALDLDDPLVHKNVRELTYKEIMSLPLKSGNRPPLLFDVLRSAQVIGGDARMIVEIKPGNVEAGTALAKMFARHPHLMERCAVIMSFDAYAMQNLKRELEVVFPSFCEEVLPHHRIHPSRSSMAMRVGSPEHHDLAAAGLTSLSGAGGHHPPLLHHHGHRRGVSVGGVGANPNIPTAMSIGDIHALVPPHAVPIVDAVGGSAHSAAASGLDARARSKSIDQLGMSLDGLDGLGVGKDSFIFSPFGQLGRVPSMHREASGSKPPKTLETIPGGKRVENAKPHPPGADPPPLSKEPPVVASTHAPPPPPQATTVAIPQLLLITRNGPAKNKEQEDALEVDVSKPSDMARVNAWLHGGSPRDRLDGLYMQYQPYMLEPEGIQAMKTLTEQYSIGIWGANPKPDDYETFSRLVRDCGVSYFNSGLQKRFMRNIRKSESSSNLMMADRTSTAAEMIDQNSRTWPKPPKQTVHLGLPW